MTSEILLTINLDENKVPERITWHASETGEGEKECQAFNLSIWDPAEKSTLRIDLWTKDLRVDDMTQHFIQTVISQAESFEKATQTKGISQKMKTFCEGLLKEIGEQMQQSQQK